MNVDDNILSSERCASAFGQMFWAFIFFFDFRIGINHIYIDILPDFIGWVLMTFALISILDLSPQVSLLRTLACWLIFLSLFDVVEIRIPIDQHDTLTLWTTPTVLFGFIVYALNLFLSLFFIWKLCGLIMDMAHFAHNSDLLKKADFRRKLYVAYTLFSMVVFNLIFAIPSFFFVMFIVSISLAIIILCLMMGLMKRTEHMCRALASRQTDYIQN